MALLRYSLYITFTCYISLYFTVQYYHNSTSINFDSFAFLHGSNSLYITLSWLNFSLHYSAYTAVSVVKLLKQYVPSIYMLLYKEIIIAIDPLFKPSLCFRYLLLSDFVLPADSQGLHILYQGSTSLYLILHYSLRGPPKV